MLPRMPKGSYPRQEWVDQCVAAYRDLMGEQSDMGLDLSTTMIRTLSDWHGYLNGTVDRNQVAGSLRDTEIIMQAMICRVLLDEMSEREDSKNDNPPDEDDAGGLY